MFQRSDSGKQQGLTIFHARGQTSRKGAPRVLVLLQDQNRQMEDLLDPTQASVSLSFRYYKQHL
eukprot:6471685-Amphidinium_carterae.4